jgi:hypothetical protein
MTKRIDKVLKNATVQKARGFEAGCFVVLSLGENILEAGIFRALLL